MVKKGFRKEEKSVFLALLILISLVSCVFCMDLVHDESADGAVQGHEEILKLDRQLASTGLTEAEVRDYIPIQYSVDYNYAEAYKMVDMVNQLRRSEGEEPLIVNDYLMKLSMDRTAQMRVFSSHVAIIPNFPYSPSDTTIVYPYSVDTTAPIDYGENLTTCSGTAESAFTSFSGSSGHYRNMVSGMYKYMGIGIVNDYCVMLFYTQDIEKSPTFDPNGEYGKLGNGSGEYTGYTPRKIAKQNFMNTIVFSSSNVNYIFNNEAAAIIYPEGSTGGYLACTDKKTNKQTNNTLLCGDALTLKYVTGPALSPSQFTLTSSDTSVIEINGQTATAKKAGTTTISVYYTAAPDVVRSATITVKAKDEDKKDKDEKSKVTVDLIYSKAVIDKETKTAEFTGMNKKYAKNLAGYTMPNTISYNGKSYKVTSIGNNAFKNCKNLKKITIPKNIKTIGSNAFRGCSKLQTITVQSTKITKVGKNAFKGIKKNAKIKVPKKKLAAYKKLMKGKGQKVKVVKK